MASLLVGWSLWTFSANLCRVEEIENVALASNLPIKLKPLTTPKEN
ncbi:hypothetical protein D082_00190 [Synechocystis sp. PCC 6714]|nr:hypothetical protein D082_00190 [Synechocystis sp. PCC 6714]